MTFYFVNALRNATETPWTYDVYVPEHSVYQILKDS